MSPFTYYLLQSGVEMELVESQPLLEWLANNYKMFGATLEIITDKSQEGSQFVRGFGGIGGKSIVGGGKGGRIIRAAMGERVFFYLIN